MQYAVVNGVRRAPAQTGERGTCPGCGEPTLSKCGRVVIWHWAHRRGGDCDSWWEPESKWHLGWKDRLASEDRQEVVIRSPEGDYHRADLIDPKNIVVELQHSPISGESIEKREVFYKAHAAGMVWLFDCTSKQIRLPCCEPPARQDTRGWWFPLTETSEGHVGHRHQLHWSRPPAWTFQIQCMAFLDYGDVIIELALPPLTSWLRVHRLWEPEAFVQAVRGGELGVLVQESQLHLTKLQEQWAAEAVERQKQHLIRREQNRKAAERTAARSARQIQEIQQANQRALEKRRRLEAPVRRSLGEGQKAYARGVLRNLLLKG